MLDSGFWLTVLCFSKLGTHGDGLLASTDSGFSALINARLSLGYWSHGMRNGME